MRTPQLLIVPRDKTIEECDRNEGFWSNSGRYEGTDADELFGEEKKAGSP